MLKRPRRPDSSDDGSAPAGLSRRQLLRGGAAALGGGVVASGLAACGGDSAATSATSGPGAGHVHGATAHASQSQRLRALSRREAEILSAMADRVFPADAESPSATEVGVVAYIDGQLAGGWGSGDRFYRSGPFPEPQDSGHGYQLR